jgi:hypothetical protein
MFASPVSSISVGAVSAGSLLGTAGTSALLSSINESLGGSNFFGSVHDTYREIRNSFVENIIRPIQQATVAMTNVVNILLNPDVIRPIIEEEQLKAIPPCMHEPIIMFPPLRAMLEQGRITGFGYDPEHLPNEDVWGRIIGNGCVNDVMRSVDEHGEVPLDWHWESTDPNPSFEEMDAVAMTRDFIFHVLETTTLDPTDYPEQRG